MYKFTNGLIVFDKKTADDFVKAGYKLLSKQNAVKVEEKNENSIEYKSITEEYKRSKKETK
ncbi:MAG: hypothetical protein IJN13_00455 [Bacilli bacterium]|nr:hypothetical protein [Bacilli bacterium]